MYKKQGRPPQPEREEYEGEGYVLQPERVSSQIWVCSYILDAGGSGLAEDWARDLRTAMDEARQLARAAIRERKAAAKP